MKEIKQHNYLPREYLASPDSSDKQTIDKLNLGEILLMKWWLKMIFEKFRDALPMNFRELELTRTIIRAMQLAWLEKFWKKIQKTNDLLLIVLKRRDVKN